MFFFLSKALGFLIQPLSWIIILSLLAFITKNKKWKKKWAWMALGTFLFFSNSFVIDEVTRWWETPAARDQELPDYKLAVVLGGMSGYDPQYDRIQFRRGSDRLWQAIRLQQMGKVESVIVSGGSGKVLHPEEVEAFFIKRYLKEIHYPSPVHYEWLSRNTHENAIYSANLADSLQLGREILLVTSALHMPRAVACFEKQGFKVTAYSADRLAGDRKWEPDHLLLPNAAALIQWSELMREIVGYVSYYFMNYL